MNPTRLFTSVLAATTLAATLAACGSSGDDSKADEAPTQTTASATPSPETSPETSTEASPETSADQDELQAKIAVNAPPKDLRWLDPGAPADWRRLQTESGTAQWQVGKEPCTVTMTQPSGVGNAKSPTSEEVVSHEIDMIAEAIKTQDVPKVVAKDSVMIPNQVVGFNGTTATKFAHSRVEFGNATEGDVRAMRSGDFALVATAICGKDRFKAVYTSQIESVLAKLAAKTVY